VSPQAWLRAALACSLAPLAVGMSIFVLWLPTRWDFLMPLGLLTILGATALFPVGVVCVMRYVVRSRDTGLVDRVGARAVLAAGLLVLNFPAGGIVVVAANAWRTRCTVTFVNASDRPVDDFLVLAGEPVGTTGPVPKGRRPTVMFRLAGEGTIRYRIVVGAQVEEGVIEGYADTGTGGDWKVTREPDGSVRVRDLPRLLVK
jgi:hypothetical protein